MIGPLHDNDLAELSRLIDVPVRESIGVSETEARFLIDDIVQSLHSWQAKQSSGFHAGYFLDDVLVGFVIVKDYWNLSHLFVLPQYQRQGIGRQLVDAAVRGCRDKSPRGKIQLNSSHAAARFYAAMGFKQTADGIDRPGGCLPFEYVV